VGIGAGGEEKCLTQAPITNQTQAYGHLGTVHVTVTGTSVSQFVFHPSLAHRIDQIGRSKRSVGEGYGEGFNIEQILKQFHLVSR